MIACKRNFFMTGKNPYLMSKIESIRTYMLVHLQTQQKTLTHRGHLYSVIDSRWVLLILLQ